MKQLIPLMVFFTVGTMLSAQRTDSCTYELQGIILDADTKEAIPYVQVIVKETQRFTLTDLDGKFYLEDLCDESNTILISCLGYCDTTCQHFYEGKESPYIYLKKEVSSLETVMIVAAKTKDEGTISIAQQRVDNVQLSADPTQTLAAAISGVNGVTFASAGNNVQLPVIHGLYGNRVLTLNNGVKHGFQNWGSDHAPEIDISSANSVTVVKGAAGVRYGPEALGGAIVVEADPLYLNEPLRARVGTGYQTNGNGYFANAEIGQGWQKWSYHLGANYTKIGDRRTPDYSLTNSGKEEKGISGGLRYRLENLDFKVYYSYLNQNLALLRSSIASSGTAFVKAINSPEPVIIRPFSYEINPPRQFAQHHFGKAEAKWRYADDASLTLRVSSQLNQREEYDVRRNAELPIIDLDLITSDYQLEWEHPEWLNLNGLIGLQAFVQNNDNNPGTGTTPFIPNYNTFRYSAFVIESLKINRVTFELGDRLDYETNDVRGRKTNQELFADRFNFANLTSSLGYIHRVSDNTTFRTNFGTAWRTPNMAELYSFGQHGFRTSFGLLRYYTNEDGNLRTDRVTLMESSDVTPEKGFKWINEWQLRKNPNTYTFTAYANYIEDFIFDRPLAVVGTVRGPMPVFIFDQADALFAGADISWQRKWSSTLDGTLDLSYLWSRNLKRDETLINQPPMTVGYKLNWTTPNFWKVNTSQLSLNTDYTFQQFQAPRTVRPDELIDGSVVITTESEIFDFRDAPDGYFLLDLSWRLDFGPLNVGVSIQNAFNARYRNYLNEMRYFADEPGRNILFTVNYSFNNKST